MDVEKKGNRCIAIRLHPLVLILNEAGIRADERMIRQEFNRCYGKPYVGNQHFLDPSHSSPEPIRSKSYSNTKHAKCIFVPRSDVEHHITEMLFSAAG